MHACSHVIWTEIRLYSVNKNVKKRKKMSCVCERVHVWNKKSSPDLQKDSSRSLQPSDELMKGEVAQFTNCWWSVSCAGAHSVFATKSQIVLAWHGLVNPLVFKGPGLQVPYDMKWKIQGKEKQLWSKIWNELICFDEKESWRSLCIPHLPICCPTSELEDCG